MPKYNEFYYLNGYYGIRSALAYSAEPITATAIDYKTVLVEFLTPTGTYSDFRLVRSQLGLPQTQEDGAIIYSSVGAPSTTSVEDSADNAGAPLIYGRFVFYRAWVRKTESSYWVPAGDTFTLLPSPHSLGLGRDAVYSGAAADGYSTDDVLLYSDTRVDPFVSTTHERFMAMLPRVLTTATNSGMDVVNDEYNKDAHDTGAKGNNLISTFLSAFSFTLDEFITFASLITPDTAIHWASPTSVYLGSHQLGMTLDVEPVTSTQRRLLRNAMKIYQEKGTRPGLELLIQSMTSYDVTLTDTANLLLTVADATFNLINWEEGQPVGSWTTTSPSITIAPYSDGVPLQRIDVAKTLDETYCLRVNPTVAGKGILLGTSDPVKTAIPVQAGLEYTASLYFKEETAVGTTGDYLGAEFIWYDRFGQIISKTEDFFLDPLGNEDAIGVTWTRFHTNSQIAPVGAVYASLGIYFAATYPVHIDMVQFEQSAVATEYEEPRGVIIHVNPTKRNFIKNPTFVASTSFWDKGGSTVSLERYNDDSRSYAGSLKAVMGSDPGQVYYTEFIPVTPGLYYSVSGHVKDISSFKNWQIQVEFSNGPDTDTTFIGGNPVGISQTEWTRIAYSAKAPAGYTKARVYFSSDSSDAAGGEVLFDAIQFENTYAATDYFDGYLTDDGGEWEGVANESYSVNYPSKSVRLQRLENEIQDFIGFDTPYYIETTEGPYSAGIS